MRNDVQSADSPQPEFETEFDSVGEPISRVDAKLKVTGRALYLEDIELSGMLVGKMLRSTCAHGKIVSIDTSEACKVPGVVGIVTGEDLDFLHGESLSDEPYLARGKVRYVGEAVAGVAAVDEASAVKARDLIKVVYEPKPAVFDAVKAVKPDAPKVHKDVGTYQCAPGITAIPDTNICNHFQLDRGDIEAGFKASDRIFEDDYRSFPGMLGEPEIGFAFCRIELVAHYGDRVEFHALLPDISVRPERQDSNGDAGYRSGRQPLVGGSAAT